MARGRRIKPRDQECYYHIMSRLTDGVSYLSHGEKQKLLNTIFYFNEIFTFDAIGYCIMGNHFHLVVRSNMMEGYSEEEQQARMSGYFIRNKKDVEDLSPEEYEKYLYKLGDVSAYVGRIKQHFACWYNDVHERRGCFWSSRFKNIMVETEENLQNVLSYIELNPVRAKMVENPEDYTFSSIHLRKYKRAEANVKLSLEGVFRGVENYNSDEINNGYSDMVHIMAKLKEGNEVKSEFIKKNGIKAAPELMLKRRREFTYGLCLASKEGIRRFYEKFGDKYLNKKDRKVHLVEDSNDLYIARKLKKPK